MGMCLSCVSVMHKITGPGVAKYWNTLLFGYYTVCEHHLLRETEITDDSSSRSFSPS